MTPKTYSDKLKDPRWQKKRLQVLSRDKFKCTLCSRGEHTLHVHHLRYEKSGNPWDSKIIDLETLCEQCHEVKEMCKNSPGVYSLQAKCNSSGVVLYLIYLKKENGRGVSIYKHMNGELTWLLSLGEPTIGSIVSTILSIK